jgi:tetratricopeptide (TPR) repeat protein
MLLCFVLFNGRAPFAFSQQPEVRISQQQDPQQSSSTTLQMADKKNASAYRLEKIKEWRYSACSHRPGEADASAITIGNWPEDDLDLVVDYVVKLSAQSRDTVKRFLEKQTNRNALSLTEQEAKTGDLSRLLMQGTLLHTDIALQNLATGKAKNTKRKMGIYLDGNVTILSPPPDHWEYACRLQVIGARLQSKDTAKQWYVATIALLQSKRLVFYAGRNIQKALDQFPEDEQILFLAGALHETWASPLMQNSQMPLKATNNFGTSEKELKTARQFFEKAVAFNPKFVEARLHLGRVLGLLGKHQESVSELKTALAAIKDDQLLYYTLLSLGRELKMTGHFDEAANSFEQAAIIYPKAQSPLLALSRLAYSHNDFEKAQEYMQRIFALKYDNSTGNDPWWSYSISHVRDASSKIDALYKKYGEPSQ